MKKLLAALKKLLGSSKGFTLIELLVVIAVMGVLLVGTIVAINPVQKINQSKDANGKAAVDQLASAIQAYYTSNSSSATPYPADLDALVDAGEIKAVPAPNGTTLEYYTDNAEARVYFVLNIEDTTSPGCDGGTACTLWCWQTTSGKAGPVAAGACTPNP